LRSQIRAIQTIPTQREQWQEKNVKVRTRFIKSVVAAAKADTTQMPWDRGAQRAMTLAARQAPAQKLRLGSA